MKTRKYIIVVGLLNLWAAENLFSQPNVEIGGRLQYDHISYFDEKLSKINSRNEGFLQVDLHSAKEARTQWKSVIEFREDLSDKTRNRVWIEELWMKQSFGNLDITAGKQVISWGTADGLNPVNNINPIDYSDLLDTEDERIGVYGLRGQLFMNTFDIDLFWSPIPVTGKLPGLTSRWFPSAEMMSIPANLLKTGASLVVTDQPPALKIDDGEAALRLRKRFQGLDIALSYFNGYDHLPEYTLDASGVVLPQPQLVLKSAYRRQQVIGVEFSTTLPAGFGLRGESALFIPDQKTVSSDRYIQSILGVDKNITMNASSLLVIAQYVYDYNVDGDGYAKFDVRHLFKNTIMGSMEWSFNNGLNINLVGAYNIDNKDYYFSPELCYTTSGGIRLIVMANILQGSSGTFFGSYSDNDRIQCKVCYNF